MDDLQVSNEKKKTYYFPLNPGWFIRILKKWFIIILI